jgi:hypothetical protein
MFLVFSHVKKKKESYSHVKKERKKGNNLNGVPLTISPIPDHTNMTLTAYTQ